APVETDVLRGDADTDSDREGRRRRRRGSRGARDRSEAVAAGQGGEQDGVAAPAEAEARSVSDMSGDIAAQPTDTARPEDTSSGVAQATSLGEPPQEGVAEGGRRRGRGRDRTRSDRSSGAEPAAADQVVIADAGETSTAEGAAAPADGAPADATVPAVPLEAPAAGRTGGSAQVQAMARVEPYVLPLEALQQLAEQAGLHWAHSDPEKIAAAQAAIAAQPAPVHVPRERRPAVVIDEGPLILVETRQDLSQMRLPFEVAQG
ncbi:MAG: hypothetical protein ACO305_07855, partial [Rubrivivax sp.]